MRVRRSRSHLLCTKITERSISKRLRLLRRAAGRRADWLFALFMLDCLIWTVYLNCIEKDGVYCLEGVGSLLKKVIKVLPEPSLEL